MFTVTFFVGKTLIVFRFIQPQVIFVVQQYSSNYECSHLHFYNILFEMTRVWLTEMCDQMLAGMIACDQFTQNFVSFVIPWDQQRVCQLRFHLVNTMVQAVMNETVKEITNVLLFSLLFVFPASFLFHTFVLCVPKNNLNSVALTNT